LRLSAVGDVCHTLPVVRTLQAAWPTTRITWIVGRLEASLVGDIPDIEFITFDKSKGLGAYTALRRTLKSRRFDMLLHMQISLRASLASLAVKAPVRLGFDKERAHDFQWLFTNRRIVHRDRQHVMDGLFGFSEALGLAEHVLRWDIPIPAPADAAAVQCIGGKPTLIISPCTKPRFRNWRNWQPEHYAALAEYAATGYGMQVLVTGGRSDIERDYGERITALAKTSVTDLVGKTSLKELLALLKHATVLVSPDSGPVHMATAIGTPVIGLYATANPGRTGPYLSQRWLVNRYPDALAKFNDGQTPEQAPWGTRVRDAAAMDCISVADVAGKLDELMAAKARGERLVQEA
jgi:heptosyltransferase I